MSLNFDGRGERREEEGLGWGTLRTPYEGGERPWVLLIITSDLIEVVDRARTGQPEAKFKTVRGFSCVVNAYSLDKKLFISANMVNAQSPICGLRPAAGLSLYAGGRRRMNGNDKWWHLAVAFDWPWIGRQHVCRSYIKHAPFYLERSCGVCEKMPFVCEKTMQLS